MASGTILSNLTLLLFLIAPGYVGLKGYLDSTVQLDTFSRIDKIFVATLFGLILLFLVLLANRFGILVYLYDYGWAMIRGTEFVSPPIEYGAGESVSADSLPDYSSLAVLSIVLGESILGYFIGYIVGTAVRVHSKTPQSSEKDLQQPWATAIRQSEPYDNLEITTSADEKIVGKLYRIGSPSEDRDVLLFGAKKITSNGNKRLGMSYHSFEDISQIQFPELEPEYPGPEDNYILRTWELIKEPRTIYDGCKKKRDRLQEIPGSFKKNIQIKYTGFKKFTDEEIIGFFEQVVNEGRTGYYMADYDSESVIIASTKANALKKAINENVDSDSN